MKLLIRASQWCQQIVPWLFWGANFSATRTKEGCNNRMWLCKVPLAFKTHSCFLLLWIYCGQENEAPPVTSETRISKIGTYLRWFVFSGVQNIVWPPITLSIFRNTDWQIRGWHWRGKNRTNRAAGFLFFKTFYFAFSTHQGNHWHFK